MSLYQAVDAELRVARNAGNSGLHGNVSSQYPRVETHELKNNPCCPVCEANDWEVLGRRTYRRSAIATSSEYVRKRLRVLFEVWYPDRDEVENTSLLCQRCGMVIYSPRPSGDDLDRKYRFLGTLSEDENQQQITARGEAERAQRLWKKLHSQLPGGTPRVLDFGGGDGRLLRPFAAHGCECFVVDYVDQAVEGVTRLGATLDEVQDSERFEMIVCSHVIEHVAGPRVILQRLREHLVDGGAIYVEVPMEIWRKPPLHEEPVTHVNFFTVSSLRTLLQSSGLMPLRVKLEGYAHPLGHQAFVVAGIGKYTKGRVPPVDYAGRREAARLLDPSWTTRLQRSLLNPGGLMRAISRRVKGSTVS